MKMLFHPSWPTPEKPMYINQQLKEMIEEDTDPYFDHARGLIKNGSIQVYEIYRSADEIEIEYLNAMSVQEKCTRILYLDDMIESLEAVRSDLAAPFSTNRQIAKFKKRSRILKELLDKEK